MEVSTCQCQRVGTLPVSWHCQKTHLERAPLGRKQVRTTTRNDVRCRACSFSAGGWTFSFRASPLRPSDLPRPNWIVSRDRKSTRLNSSHTVISYAVFCLKKKKTTKSTTQLRTDTN